MNVLVLGSGGREHALAWKIAQSPLVAKVYCAPGNPGMGMLEKGECVPLLLMDFGEVTSFIAAKHIDLTVVGPEDPLAAGIVDALSESGCKVFGPHRAAARLEGSKRFAKKFMLEHGMPTAAYAEFDDPAEAMDYIREQGAPLVVKADGLAAGKGVTVALTEAVAEKAVREAMIEGAFGEAGARIIIEEYLKGEEASILTFCDGRHFLSMPASQDHKPAYDDDEGPNTGGMGAYSPAPVVNEALMEEVEARIIRPCIEGMAAQRHPYKGVLYTGLMITESGPKVVEFNCRFGDPETQVVLPRMEGDLVPVLMACCDGTLDRCTVTWSPRACVTVVMASGGYPMAYERDKVIEGIAQAEEDPDVTVFHAGTAQRGSDIVTHGGRVLNVTATGDTLQATIDAAYRAVSLINFEQAHFRTDIGRKALDRLQG